MPTTVPVTVTTMNAPPELAKQGIYDVSTIQNHPLGARLPLGDGRTFAYALNGSGAAITPSMMNQSPAWVLNHKKCAVAATANVGVTAISVTLGATAATVNQYADGYIYNDNGAYGYKYYKIRSHLAIGSGGTGTINTYDPVITQMTSSAFVTLIPNPYNGTVVAPTTFTGPCIGVNLVDVPASNYYWVQTWGPCNCLIGAGPPTVGQSLIRSAATAGALIVMAAAGQVVGTMMQSEAAADYGLVFLSISP
mgnify:CR=1 FL=1